MELRGHDANRETALLRCSACGDALEAGRPGPTCAACREADALLALAAAHRRELAAAGFAEAAATLARLSGRLVVLREMRVELRAIGGGDGRLAWNRRAIRRASADLANAVALRRGAVQAPGRAA